MTVRHWIQLFGSVAMLAWSASLWLYPAFQKVLLVIPVGFAAWSFYFAYWSHQQQRRERKRRGFELLPPGHDH